MDAESGLRAANRRRTEAAIVAAALDLFTERGFDEVTVSDIAERARVGRATFFRYFADKQEVVFAENEGLAAVVGELASLRPARPLTDLPAALAHTRLLVERFVDVLAAEPETFATHERLVADHPELLARSLVKQQGYVVAVRAALRRHGAEETVAHLAAEIGMACYRAGAEAALDDPTGLPRRVQEAFDLVLG